MLAIFFFAVIFAASLLYSVKSKKDTLASFLINLEIEYVLLGILVYYIAQVTVVPAPSFMKPIMHLVLAFMGLVIGTHFSIKLLSAVPRSLFFVSLTIYAAGLPFIYITMMFLKVDNPFIYSIMLNTLMPYSVNLGSRLFKFNRERIYLSGLISSLFPLFTLFAYTATAGFHDYRPKDFSLALGLAIFFSILFSIYGKHKSKKIIHKLSIMFVFVIAGIAQYEGISPLVIGFIIGFILSDSSYGNIFHNVTVSFERFFYIFFYVALGILLAFYRINIDGLVVGGALLISLSLYMARYVLAEYMVSTFLPMRKSFISIFSTGILPVVMILDFGTRHGYDGVNVVIPMFFLIHIITEIFSFAAMKNEKKAD